MHPVSRPFIINCAYVDPFACQKPKVFANYVSCVQTGNVIHTAGHLPILTDGSMIKGTLGNELEVEDGYRAARACAIGLISTIKGSYGSGLMFFFFSAAEAVDFRDVTQTKCITSRCSILYMAHCIPNQEPWKSLLLHSIAIRTGRGAL